ncbi:hypothetical protein V2J09_003173 [Rumex salicifolius]
MEADRNLDCGDNSGAENRHKREADHLTEDEKVEKFYDLIKNYKEALDRKRIEMQRLTAGEVSDCDGDKDDEKRRRMKKLKLGDRDQTSWIPAFKWEDFEQNAPAEHRCSPVIPSASNSGEINKERRMREDVKDSAPAPADLELDGGGLDLKLRL